MIATLAGSGLGDGDVGWPGDATSGQARPATTVTACIPRGGSGVVDFDLAGLWVAGLAADKLGGVGAAVTGGTGGTDGNPLTGLSRLDSEPAGAPELVSAAGARSRVLAAADDDTADGDASR